jgi:hypothetical protein
MLTRRRALAGAALSGAALAAGRSAAEARPAVDMVLVLAADGSGSIDAEEFRLQRQGYADALAHPDVLRAIAAGRERRIGVSFVEWASDTSVATIVDWRLVSDAASGRAFGAALVAAPRVVDGYNSISRAIVHSQRLIETAPYRAGRKVIDISGDGPNFGGPPLAEARRAALAAGIVINAIAIKTRGGHHRGRAGEPLEENYAREVIGGPGAFVMVADETTSFAEVVLRKLVREVA